MWRGSNHRQLMANSVRCLHYFNGYLVTLGCSGVYHKWQKTPALTRFEKTRCRKTWSEDIILVFLVNFPVFLAVWNCCLNTWAFFISFRLMYTQTHRGAWSLNHGCRKGQRSGANIHKLSRTRKILSFCRVLT